MVDLAEENYKKALKKATYYVEEIEEKLNYGVTEDLRLAYERICDINKGLEDSANGVKDAMLDAETSFDEVRKWSDTRKQDFIPVRNLRDKLKEAVSDLEKQELHKKKEDWFNKKFELELALDAKKAAHEMSKPQAVKLQKYSITPFKGDYKDWLRFWNQFVVEVDNSKISEISKFNYLLELVEGEPKTHILGLPHTVEGYGEAKKILELTYGKNVKVLKALIKDLETLPNITSLTKVKEIHEFYKQLSRTVRALKTMKKLQSAQSYVYSIMDKLGPVREALVQKDDEWEEWGLEELVESLRKYTDRNPLPETSSQNQDVKKSVGWNQGNQWRRGEKMFMSGPNQGPHRPPPPCAPCAYCNSHQHKSSECTKILDVASRREFLKKNRLCFNCAKSGHAVSQCKSRGCGRCNARHHTSICERIFTTLPPKSKPPSDRFYGANDHQTTLHSSVLAKVNGVQTRIMLDSGAGSSYISANLLTKLNIKPCRTENRVIEQMYGTVVKRVEIYKVHVESNVIDSFELELQCVSAEKPVLTYLPNPKISELKEQNHRIRRLVFSEEQATAEKLPVHIILGAADIQRIKSTEPPVLGLNPDTDPGAEFTMLGWVIAGKSTPLSAEAEKMFFMKSSQDEFVQMCSQEVLGLKDLENVHDSFHEDFIDQLQRLEDGTYCTRLPWKPDHASLPSNKELTVGRLRSVTRKLERMQRLEEYHTVMEQQLEEGIIEVVPEIPTGEAIHYIPHQPVIRDQAESTKMRIVYDCSAKANFQVPSLNDCLEVGPSLQPMIFDILLRNRLRLLCITGDIQKAFLQIKVDPKDRDALRLLWYENLDSRTITEYRYTRVIFGSGPSPYILGATLKKHLSQYTEKFPDTANELLNNTYVDDVQSGGDDSNQLIKFKEEATKIMEEGGFHLHKWHSNLPELEECQGAEKNAVFSQASLTYAKLEVGTSLKETKILGVPWNKTEDKLSVGFTKPLQAVAEGPLTKRKMLSAVNCVYDLLGVAAPVVITGKILYSETCLRKLKWDEQVPDDIRRSWNKWLRGLEECPVLSVPRSVVNKDVTEIALHGFSDASKLAVSAAIYALVLHADASVCQNLLVAKSRIAPRELSTPRLELIAAHTLSKLINHVKEVIQGWPVREYHCWVDSTTVLYWIKGQGTWTQFVRNRTQSIQDKGYLKWHYVPTSENPSDQGSRGIEAKKLGRLWFEGPKWLNCPDKWPSQPEVCETSETLVETVKPKLEKQMLAKEEEKNLIVDELLHRYSSYWKLLRVTAYVKRFINNCKKTEKQKGPLRTEEMQAAERFWIIQAQAVPVPKSGVHLEKDEDGILRCVGRVPGYYPIFLSRECELTSLVVQQVHKQTLHGGVSVTMCCMREKFWVPKLRSLTKKVIRNCNVCKRYREKPISASHVTTAALPTFRVEISDPFAVTGVDFAGPVYYRVKKSITAKAYIALFTCASTRAVHLKLCHDLSSAEFQRALKEFITRRGCPQILVSDNGKTFVATGKWLSTLKKDHNLASYVGALNIKWKFNLARAPWWGGFFERLIGIMKRALSKMVGRSLLTFPELEDVLIDIENCMNNRPLLYQGEEFEQPVLTPNTLLRGKPTPVLEEDLEAIGEEKVSRRMKFLQRSKEQLRRRFLKEYVHALGERKSSSTAHNAEIPETGAVVLLKGEVKDRALWKLGRVVDRITGRDGVVRGLKLKQGNGYVVERPLQLVCNLEIGGENPDYKLNPEAEVFVPRVRLGRRTKELANKLFKDIAAQEVEDGD